MIEIVVLIINSGGVAIDRCVIRMKDQRIIHWLVVRVGVIDSDGRINGGCAIGGTSIASTVDSTVMRMSSANAGW